MDTIEKKLVQSLNNLCVHGITLSNGVEMTMKFFSHNDPNWRAVESEKEEGLIRRKLLRSRPYIGTVVYFGSRNINAIRNRLYRFAIACGRTTPEFLDTFVDSKTYLESGTPSRNVYHPGQSVIFIARRGWTCFEVESRDKRAFQSGVVDVVTHSVQAVLASVRATRWVVAQIAEEGTRADVKLKTALDRAGKGSRIRFWQILFPLESERIIRDFTNYLTRARIVSPFDDLSILLSSHLTTHTGIAAVERIRQLTGHKQLMEAAHRTVENYGASLEGANQYWTTHNVRVVRISLFLALLALSVSAIAIALTF